KKKKLNKDLKNSSPRSADKKVALKNIKNTKLKIKFLAQKEKYLKIRTERRRIEGRRQYKINFSQNKPWPDPQEYTAYLKNKSLNDIDLNWQSRVPKLFKENPNYRPPQLETSKESKKKEEGEKEE
ncbi:MAG: hypothetical protein KDD50_04010, partial [Bdellovibrionales bacterium]|nr:hypothetical protein [Bdellovibrionales bacterium]